MKYEREVRMAEMKNQTSRAGRPARELRPGERVPMSFRVTAETKRRMDEAARESGRSVAQEIEQRLDKSFERGPLLDEALLLAFDEGLAGILPSTTPGAARGGMRPRRSA